jgi:GMP synthase (glutamine-hydrolysing)
MVVKLPEGAVVLAGNEFTPVQAMAVSHKRGTFWSTQYHPEYNLHEMARLTVARIDVLSEQGFFADSTEAEDFISRWELLHREPDRKDLQWQLGIDDHILSEKIRQQEFANWIRNLVLPHSKKKEAGARL